MKAIYFLPIVFLFQVVAGFSQEYAIDDINTRKHSEYSPSISFDGKTLVFESNKTGKWRLYESQQMGEKRWSNPTPLDEINSTVRKKRFVGGCFQSYDGKYLLMTSDRKDGFGNMDILISEKKNGKWTSPKNIGAPINSNYYEGFPSLSLDGTELYFMRNFKPGSSEDQKKGFLSSWFGHYPLQQRYFLYMSRKQANDQWGEPELLVDEINNYPVECLRILPDGKTLIFASKRPDSNGGFDIYRCVKTEDGAWSQPENLQQVNSEYDENTFTVDAAGELLYFARTINYIDDIFLSPVPARQDMGSTIQLSGQVFDIETKLPIAAQLVLIDADTQDTIRQFLTTLQKSEYQIYLPKGKNIIIEANSQGYSFASEQLFLKSPELNLEDTKSKRMDLAEVFDQIVMDNDDEKLFASSQERISDADKMILDDIQKNSIRIKELKAEIVSETDFREKKKLVAETEKLKTENVTLQSDAITNYWSANHDILTLLTRYISRYQVSSNERISGLGKQLEKDGENFWNQAMQLRMDAENETPGSNKLHLKAKELESKAIQKYVLAFEYYLQYLNFNKNHIRKDIYLTPLKKDVSIVLENIQFAFDSDELNPQSVSELKKVLRLLNENPNLKIELSAHTDSKGSDQYNMKLSDRRANSVVDWLTSNHISVDRLKAVGYGENHPLVPNDTEENRAINRRVEFMILEN